MACNESMLNWRETVFLQFKISRLVKKANLFANSLKKIESCPLSPVSLFD